MSDRKRASELLALGVEAYQRGDVADAERLWEDAIGADPSFAKAEYNLALSVSNRGAYAQSEKHYQRAIDNDPNWAAPEHALATLLMEHLGRHTEAERHYRRAIDNDPTWAEPEIGLAHLLAGRLGRYAEAEQHYLRAIDKDPSDAYSENGLANLLQDHLGRYAEAEEHYQRAIDKRPTWAHPENGLANLLKKHLGRYQEAEQHYRRAIDKDPTYAAPENGLANVLQDHLGRYAEAEEHYQRAIDKDPTNAYPENGLANLLADRLGRHEEATEHYVQADRKALASSAGRLLEYGNVRFVGTTLVRAARCAARLGDVERVVERLEQALARCDAALAEASTEALAELPTKYARWYRHRFSVRSQSLAVLPQVPNALLRIQERHRALAYVADDGGRTVDALLRCSTPIEESLTSLSWRELVRRDSGILEPLLVDLHLAEQCRAEPPAVARLTTAALLLDAATQGPRAVRASLSLLALMHATDTLVGTRAGDITSSTVNEHDVTRTALQLFLRALAHARDVGVLGAASADGAAVAVAASRLMSAVRSHTSDGDPVRAAIDATEVSLTLLRYRQRDPLHAGADIVEMWCEGLLTRWEQALATTRAAYRSLFASLATSQHLHWRATADAIFRELVEGALAMHDLRALACVTDGIWQVVDEDAAPLLAARLLKVREVNERALGGGSGEQRTADPRAVDGRHVMLLCGTEHLVRVTFDHGAVSVWFRRAEVNPDSGRMHIEQDWMNAHATYRRTTAGKGKGAVRKTPPQPKAGESAAADTTEPSAPESALSQPLVQATTLLEGLDGASPWTLTVDSVLVDLPWCSLGAMLGVPVRGMTLDPPRHQAPTTPSSVLVVVSDELLDAMLGWRNAWDAGKAPPLLAQLVQAVGAERLVILRVGDPPPAKGETTNAHRVDSRGRPVPHVSDALSPDLVVWLTHGMPDVQAGGRMAMLGLHGGHMLRAAGLIECGGRFVIPCDAPVTVTLPPGCRFVASACLAGMVDTKMPSSEAVGMVRALMASGVTEAFCPAFEVPLAETPLTRDGMRQPVLFLIEQVAAAALAGRTMADALPGAMAEVSRWEKRLDKGEFVGLDVDEWAWANLWVA